MKLPGDPASPLSWLGDGLTQCESHVRQSPLCVLPSGCPQAWFIIQESPSPPNNDGSVAESLECEETGPALLGRPVPSNLPPGRCLTLRGAPHGCHVRRFHRPRRPTLEPDDGRRVRSDAGDRTVPRSCDGPPGVFRCHRTAAGTPPVPVSLTVVLPDSLERGPGPGLIRLGIAAIDLERRLRPPPLPLLVLSQLVAPAHRVGDRLQFLRDILQDDLQKRRLWRYLLGIFLLPYYNIAARSPTCRTPCCSVIASSASRGLASRAAA